MPGHAIRETVREGEIQLCVWRFRFLTGREWFRIIGAR
jgi:hypothetical protein